MISLNLGRNVVVQLGHTNAIRHGMDNFQIKRSSFSVMFPSILNMVYHLASICWPLGTILIVLFWPFSNISFSDEFQTGRSSV